jgi:hypothetical protein
MCRCSVLSDVCSHVLLTPSPFIVTRRRRGRRRRRRGKKGYKVMP